MKKNKIIIVFLSLLFVAQPTFAYLDPGTGSAIMSLIIGLFVASGVIVKSFWYKIRGLFKHLKKSKKKISK